MHAHMENESLQHLILATQCAPELVPVPSGAAGAGTLQAVRFVLPFQLLALGSIAAAPLSGLKVGAGLSHGPRVEGVLTQKVN